MKGGARNRSGPRKSPTSARSERLGVRFGKLPRAGYTGRLPAWPLTRASAREREVWRQVWRTPQAAAWATEPWRHRAVAMYVRLAVRCEDAGSPAALHAVMVRYADQIGMTPAGMRENRWVVEETPGAAGAVVSPAELEREGTPPVAPPLVPLRGRLRVVPPGGGA